MLDTTPRARRRQEFATANAWALRHMPPTKMLDEVSFKCAKFEDLDVGDCVISRGVCCIDGVNPAVYSNLSAFADRIHHSPKDKIPVDA